MVAMPGRGRSPAFPCPAAGTEKTPRSPEPGHGTQASPPSEKQPHPASAARLTCRHGRKLVPPPPLLYGCGTACSPLLQQLIFLWQLPPLLTWDGDPRQVLQVLVSSNANRESKVPLRPWSQIGRLSLSRGYVGSGAIGLGRPAQHWGAWL